MSLTSYRAAPPRVKPAKTGKALTAIEAAAKSDAERVHDFRRAMKRWRAAAASRALCRARGAAVTG
jgi:CHAD domain-containing protein